MKNTILERIHKPCFAYMHQHPDSNMAYIGWYKCPVCGYCEQITKDNKKKEDANGKKSVRS